MIGKSSRIGVVLHDRQLGLVVEQTIEHMRRIPHGGIDDLSVKERVLVWDMHVEGDVGVVSILCVYLASRFAAAARSVALDIGRLRPSFSPVRGERNEVLTINDFG
jgi:hypothetical protein